MRSLYELDKREFGAFVAGQRRALGLTQRQLADRLGVTDKAVSKWETGQSLPDVTLLVPLAGALGVTATELLECRRVEEAEPMDSARVEQLVQTALNLSDEHARPAARVRRGRLGWYCACLAAGAAGLWLLHTADSFWFEQAVTMTGLSALFGLWFCFWARERLPAFYDENKLSFVSDGMFRLNIAGVYFNNRNWPHILRTGRTWCLASMAISPWFCLLCDRIMPESMFWVAVLLAYLGTLFVPIVVAAKRHQ